jgi:hypothetical protein
LKDQRNGFRGAFRGGSRMSQGATTRSGEIGTPRGNDVHPFLALHREMYRHVLPDNHAAERQMGASLGFRRFVGSVAVTLFDGEMLLPSG